jgi:hypothetical protein
MTALIQAIYAALPDLRPDQLAAVSTIVSGFYRENLDDTTRHLPPEDQNEFNFYRNTLESDSIVLPPCEARTAGLLSAMMTERDYLLNWEDYNYDNDDYEDDDLPPLVEDDDELPPLLTLEELDTMRETIVPEGVNFSINGQLVPPGVRVIDALNNDCWDDYSHQDYHGPSTRIIDSLDALGLLDYQDDYNDGSDDNNGWEDYNYYNDEDYLYDRTGDCQGCIDGIDNQQAHMELGGCLFKPLRGIDYE